MIEIGRVCVKLAGRDAGKRCVIIDNIDKNFVLIDGETRRKKCNIVHLEPLSKTVKLSKKASHENVVKVFKDMGIELKEKKPKKVSERPRPARGKTERASKTKRSSKAESDKSSKKKSKTKQNKNASADSSASGAKDAGTKKSEQKSKETSDNKSDTKKKVADAPKKSSSKSEAKNDSASSK